MPTGSQPHAIVSGDFNQDGKADYAVNVEVDDQVTVLINSCGQSSEGGQ